MKLSVYVILLFTCFCTVLSHASWEGKRDNQPLSELKSMDDDELISEATDVCIKVNAWGKLSPQLSVDGLEYLFQIFQVVRKKHGGKDPQWMNEILRAASTTKDPQECSRIFADFQKTHKKAISKKDVPKNSENVETHLQELKNLLDKSLITPKEYEKKRAEILKEL